MSDDKRNFYFCCLCIKEDENGKRKFEFKCKRKEMT